LRRVSCRIFSTIPSEDCPVDPTIPAPPPDDFIDHKTYAVGPERPGTDTAEKAVSSDTGNATFAQEQQRQALTNGIGAQPKTLAQNDPLPTNQQKAEDHAEDGTQPTWDNLPTDGSLPEGCIYANDPDDEDTPALRSLKELKRQIAEKMIAAFAQEREATTYYPDTDKSL